ncbi:hypothetical protein ACWGHJ_35700, partial [Streptomyces xanthophaeus]
LVVGPVRADQAVAEVLEAELAAAVAFPEALQLAGVAVCGSGVNVPLMIPQVLAALHVTFDGESRSKAFGLYGAVLSLAHILGPVMGGLLTEARLFGS